MGRAWGSKVPTCLRPSPTSTAAAGPPLPALAYLVTGAQAFARGEPMGVPRGVAMFVLCSWFCSICFLRRNDSSKGGQHASRTWRSGLLSAFRKSTLRFKRRFNHLKRSSALGFALVPLDAHRWVSLLVDAPAALGKAERAWVFLKN